MAKSGPEWRGTEARAAALAEALPKNGGTVYVTVEDGDLKVTCESSEGAAAEEATAE